MIITTSINQAIHHVNDVRIQLCPLRDHEIVY